MPKTRFACEYINLEFSITYVIILSGEKMIGNNLVMFILRTPLHPILSGNMMILTLAGRKSARPISLPVNYYRDGDIFWVTSVRDRKWWRNLKGGALVMMHLRGKEVHGYAETILDESAVVERFIAMLAIQPQSRKAYNIRVNEEDDMLNLDDLKRVAGERLFVKITLKS
jgi:hypothetical protein